MEITTITRTIAITTMTARTGTIAITEITAMITGTVTATINPDGGR
jgi:hypothetical protein